MTVIYKDSGCDFRHVQEFLTSRQDLLFGSLTWNVLKVSSSRRRYLVKKRTNSQKVIYYKQ
jgi:hypothetical protein